MRLSERGSACLCLLLTFVTSGCRLDVTQTIDTRTPGRETVVYRETFDDEAFEAATRLGGPSAFAFDAAKDDGWSVSSSSGANQHTFVITRSFSLDRAGAELTRVAQDSIKRTPIDAFPLGPTAFIGLPISAADTNERSTSIPALLRPEDTLKPGRKDPAFQRANARVNADAVNSVVHVRILLRDASGSYETPADFARPTALPPSFGAGLQIGRPWQVSPILALWQNVGPHGVFDYEHFSPPLCSSQPRYRKSWMFGVGVYANGAGIPEELLDTAGSLAEKWLATHPVKCP